MVALLLRDNSNISSEEPVFGYLTFVKLNGPG